MMIFPPPAAIVSTIVDALQFVGGSAVDEVAIFDSSYNQAFSAARIVKVTVSPTSKLMSHPIEDGSMRTDFRVIMPTEIEISMICPSGGVSGPSFADIYQEINQSYLAGDIFTVATKADTYANMMIESLPHAEDPDMFDAITVAIKMKEVIIVTTQYQALPADQTKNTNDQSTVETGSTSAGAAPPAQSESVLHSWFK
jgi:hypothetical protein